MSMYTDCQPEDVYVHAKLPARVRLLDYFTLATTEIP